MESLQFQSNMRHQQPSAIIRRRMICMLGLLSLCVSKSNAYTSNLPLGARYSPPRSSGTSSSYLAASSPRVDGRSRRTRTCSFLTIRTQASRPVGPLHLYSDGSEFPNPIFNVRTSKTRLAATTITTPRPPSSQRSRSIGSFYQGIQTVDHDILTKEKEVELGRDMKLAKEMRDDITFWVLEEERLKQEDVGSNGYEYEHELDEFENELNALNSLGMAGKESDSTGNMNGALDIDMDGLNPAGMDSVQIHGRHSLTQDNLDSGNDEPDVLLWDDVMLLNSNIPPQHSKGTNRVSKQRSVLDKTILTREGAKLNMASIDQDLYLLSPQVVATRFTKYNCTSLESIRRVLAKGSHARTTLIRSNLRLVVSISKKTMSQSNVESMPSSIWYMGGWDRPSLDEVIQEGVLGLVRAVDKWELERGLKFGTYATHWITSYVRMCLQENETGCLRIPSNLQAIKTRYKQLRRKKREMSLPMPSEDELAQELGVTPNRLQTALRVTSTLVSLDDAISSFSSGLKGSAAGESSSNQRANSIGDLLEETTESKPEDYVNRMLLRQALENAMAVELSPHERDILRMRNGLEDGQARTVKQIVEDLGGVLTMTDVRNVERKAFAKLRNPTVMYTHGLLAYLDVSDIDGDIDTFR